MRSSAPTTFFNRSGQTSDGSQSVLLDASLAGLFVGVVVFIMSITGVILTYEKQMLAWADRRAAAVRAPGPGTPRASLDTIVERIAVSVPDAAVTTITRRDDPQAPVTVAMSSGITVLVHPYTGHVIGQAPTGMRNVFRATTEWHRYLAGTDSACHG